MRGGISSPTPATLPLFTVAFYVELPRSFTFLKKKNAFCVENKEHGSFYFAILGQLDTGS